MINAIAQDVETGEIIDPFDGMKDINDKIIRCIGPIERITDDPMRMLRAMRFSITKDLQLEERIKCVFQDPESVALLSRSPLVNIRQDMNRCFDFDTHKTLTFFKHLSYIAETDLLTESPIKDST